MSNDYDEYNYDNDNNYDDNSEKKEVIKKRILIGTCIVVGIIILIFLLKEVFFNKETNEVETFDYEKTLLDAGKEYYEFNNQNMPKANGECSSVNIETLNGLNLLDISKYNSCDSKNTYVKVCLVEDKIYQWTPWLTCTTNNSESKYGKYFEGTTNNLVKDESNVKFEFLAQKVDVTDNSLGEIEELWKEDIKYKSYKTLETNDYFRYRDKEYLWNIKVKSYYTSKGSQNNADNVNEYYLDSPASGYTNKDSESKAYKWFTSNASKEYYMVDGAKGFSPTPIEGYPYNDGARVVTKYRYRYITNYFEPTLYYKCSESATSLNYEYQTKTCGNGNNPAYKYKQKSFYVCVEPGDTDPQIIDKGLSKDYICNTYSDWSEISDKTCGVDSHICQSVSVTFYNWYKQTGSNVKTYYPSGSTVASGEKMYYKEAPIDGAQKDTSTEVKAYKWYKETDGETSKYYSSAPEENATKIAKSEKWSSWSEWQNYEPEKLGNDGTRQIENRVKIKLQQIKEITDEDFKNIKENYMTEEELIKLFQDEGYKVENLLDITNNGDIRYKIKLFIRNKEGQNNE